MRKLPHEAVLFTDRLREDVRRDNIPAITLVRDPKQLKAVSDTQAHSRASLWAYALPSVAASSREETTARTPPTRR